MNQQEYQAEVERQRTFYASVKEQDEEELMKIFEDCEKEILTWQTKYQILHDKYQSLEKSHQQTQDYIKNNQNMQSFYRVKQLQEANEQLQRDNLALRETKGLSKEQLDSLPDANSNDISMYNQQKQQQLFQGQNVFQQPNVFQQSSQQPSENKTNNNNNNSILQLQSQVNSIDPTQSIMHFQQEQLFFLIKLGQQIDNEKYKMFLNDYQNNNHNNQQLLKSQLNRVQSALENEFKQININKDQHNKSFDNYLNDFRDQNIQNKYHQQIKDLEKKNDYLQLQLKIKENAQQNQIHKNKNPQQQLANLNIKSQLQESQDMEETKQIVLNMQELTNIRNDYELRINALCQEYQSILTQLQKAQGKNVDQQNPAQLVQLLCQVLKQIDQLQNHIEQSEIQIINFTNEVRLTFNNKWVNKKVYDELYIKAFSKEDLKKSQNNINLSKSPMKSSIFIQQQGINDINKTMNYNQVKEISRNNLNKSYEKAINSSISPQQKQQEKKKVKPKITIFQNN